MRRFEITLGFRYGEIDVVKALVGEASADLGAM